MKSADHQNKSHVNHSHYGRPFFNKNPENPFFQPGGSKEKAFFQPSRVGTIAKPVQAKLTIGEVGDKYEQEADQVAAKVVKEINHPSSQQKGEQKSVQRMEDEQEIQTKPILQRQEAIAGGEASTELESSINRAKGGGQPLDEGLQRSMGSAMNADFSGVRVHTNGHADQLNKSLQAKAFTTDQDVFFGQGEYQPESQDGQKLIAHELTHVVQQKFRTGMIMRTDGKKKPTLKFIGPPNTKDVALRGHGGLGTSDPSYKTRPQEFIVPQGSSITFYGCPGKTIGSHAPTMITMGAIPIYKLKAIEGQEAELLAVVEKYEGGDKCPEQKLHQIDEDLDEFRLNKRYKRAIMTVAFAGPGGAWLSDIMSLESMKGKHLHWAACRGRAKPPYKLIFTPKALNKVKDSMPGSYYGYYMVLGNALKFGGPKNWEKFDKVFKDSGGEVFLKSAINQLSYDTNDVQMYDAKNVQTLLEKLAARSLL